MPYSPVPKLVWSGTDQVHNVYTAIGIKACLHVLIVAMKPRIPVRRITAKHPSQTMYVTPGIAGVS